MDSWKHSEILAMLEGGNKQLGDFFNRHELSSSDDTSFNRYKTNAAKFYKKNLSLHVSQVMKSGTYKGRETFRKSPQKSKRRLAKEEDDDNTIGSSVIGCSNECDSLGKESAQTDTSSVGAEV